MQGKPGWSIRTVCAEDGDGQMQTGRIIAAGMPYL